MEAIERARSKCTREFRLKKDSEVEERQSSVIRRTNISQSVEHQIHPSRSVNSTSPLPSGARSRFHYSKRFLPSSNFCTFFCKGKINCVNVGLLLNYHNETPGLKVLSIAWKSGSFKIDLRARFPQSGSFGSRPRMIHFVRMRAILWPTSFSWKSKSVLHLSQLPLDGGIYFFEMYVESIDFTISKYSRWDKYSQIQKKCGGDRGKGDCKCLGTNRSILRLSTIRMSSIRR